MEFYIAWYPAAKLLVFLLLAGGIALLIKAKHYKVAGVMLALWITFLSLAPVAIDGTQGKKAHRAEVREATIYHTAQSSSNPKVVVVHTKKLTFDEKMALEDARAVKANKAVTDEINAQR